MNAIPEYDSNSPFSGILRNEQLWHRSWVDLGFPAHEFREALAYTLMHKGQVPFNPNLMSHEVARQLRDNELYGRNRTVDDTMDD